jgi:hypothetical protein
MIKVIKRFNWNSIWNKYKWHIFPFLIFVAAIIISLKLLSNDSSQIALSLTVLGAGFAIFQFWISEININRRKKYDLKYSLLKEYITSVDSFELVLDDRFLVDKIVEVDNLWYKAVEGMNKINSCFNLIKTVFIIDDIHILRMSSLQHKLDSKMLEWKSEILSSINIYSQKIEYKNSEIESIRNLIEANQNIINKINTADEDLSIKIFSIANSCYQLNTKLLSDKQAIVQMMNELENRQIQIKRTEEIKNIVNDFIKLENEIRKELISQL